MIKVLVFDLGGVVFSNDWDAESGFMRELAGYFEIPPDKISDGWKYFHHPFFEGKIDEEDFWAGVLREAGEKIDVKAAKEIWRKNKRPVSGMLALLKKLKKRYVLAALTNASREWIDYTKEKYGLDEVFEVIVSSGYAGTAKADPEIYKVLLERLGKAPENCLYIDDKERNLEPAAAMGMKTLLFRGRSDLETSLMEMGIIF